MVVIFDLDDTLTDTMASLSVARDKVIRHFGHTPTTAALERWQHASHFFDSEDFPHVLPLVMPGLAGRQIDVDEIRQLYWAWEIDNLTLKAGAADVLLGLAARGIEMALVTNGPRAKQERKVQRLALETYMSRGAVVYADGVHVPRKPSPAPIREALRLTGGADPAAAFYVGDGMSDVVAAHLAGVASVLVKSPSLVMDPPTSSSALAIETPLHTIDRLAELLAIVDQGQAGLATSRQAGRISASAS